MSALSHELLCELAKHLPGHAAMACVGKDWKHAVWVTKKKLQDRFLDATFNIDCLGTYLFRRYTQIEKRVLQASGDMGDGDIAELRRWWYNIQACLALWFRPPFATSFEHLFRLCHEYNAELRGYTFGTFQYLFCERLCDIRLQEWYIRLCNRPFGTRVFKEGGYICARDLGCHNLETSVEEVLWTLRLARGNDTYCPYQCGCSEQDENNEQTH